MDCAAMNVGDHELRRVLERVQKLRALKGSPNVHEAATAAALADKLIQEHKLEEAELEAGSGERAERPDEAPDPLLQERRATTWKWRLACGLAAHYDVAVYRQGGWGSTEPGLDAMAPPARDGMVSTLRMVGRPSDLAALRWMFAWLSTEIEQLAIRAVVGRGRRWGNAFRIGAVSTVVTALAQSKAALTRGGSGTGASIILAQRREHADQRMRELHPDLGAAARLGSATDAHGFEAGKLAGRSIDLKGPRTPRLRG
jgi:hypothetical protein